jgi:hypothetical protein
MKSMSSIVIPSAYDQTNEMHSGRDISKDFQRIVNRRVLPDYFDIIKEPVALSTLRVSSLALRNSLGSTLTND